MQDAARLVKLFEQNGFTLVRSKNHQIWRCPCGHFQTSVSNDKRGARGRGAMNAESMVAREARICKRNLEDKDRD